jgi:MFS family permease
VLLLYTLTGFGSGASNVPLMGLISHWFGRRVRGRAAGIVQSGTGLGIMGSGLLVPALGVAWGASAWRGGWLVLGLVVIVVALAAFAILRNSPAELGLQPLGSDATDASHAALPAGPLGDHRRLLLHLGAIYFLFGFTYVIYATFIVTTLVEERGFDAVLAGRFWFWVGFLSLFSGPLFGWLSDRAGRRTALVAVFALHTAAYLSVGLGLSDPFLYLSIGLFGLAAWSVPAILAVTVGDHVGPRLAVAAFGAITFVFGLGQIAGPALAGILAEMHGGFASSYLLASGLAFTALLLAARLRPPATPAAADG